MTRKRRCGGSFPIRTLAKLYPNDQATEMVSTGVESYLADPLTFARTRPEHFNLIFDIMQGKYRTDHHSTGIRADGDCGQWRVDRAAES